MSTPPAQFPSASSEEVPQSLSVDNPSHDLFPACTIEQSLCFTASKSRTAQHHNPQLTQWPHRAGVEAQGQTAQQDPDPEEAQQAHQCSSNTNKPLLTPALGQLRKGNHCPRPAHSLVPHKHHWMAVRMLKAACPTHQVPLLHTFAANFSGPFEHTGQEVLVWTILSTCKTNMRKHRKTRVKHNILFKCCKLPKNVHKALLFVTRQQRSSLIPESYFFLLVLPWLPIALQSAFRSLARIINKVLKNTHQRLLSPASLPNH